MLCTDFGWTKFWVLGMMGALEALGGQGALARRGSIRSMRAHAVLEHAALEHIISHPMHAMDGQRIIHCTLSSLNL